MWLNVSISTIDKVWRKFKKTGAYLPIPYTGRKSALIKKQEEENRTKIQQIPDITILDLIAELKLDMTESGLSRHLKKMDLTFKKRRSMQTAKNEPMLWKSVENGKKTKPA